MNTGWQAVPSRARQKRRRRSSHVNSLPIDSYARRSVGFDDEHAMNEELQHKSNRRGIASLGRELGKELRDGISAWDEEKYRVDWNEAMQRMEDGVSGGVAVWQGDRWTRQLMELEQMFLRVRGLGCVLITMGMAYQLDNPQHQQMLRMLTVQSQASSDNTSFKVHEKLEEQREQGFWNGTGRRPFGHPGLLPGSGKRRRREAPAELIEAERAALAKAYAALLQGTTSLSAIARAWNADGIRTAFGGEWSNVTVRQVLRQPLNAGLLSHYGEVLGKATNVEPIVDEETFWAAHAVFSGRGHGTKAKTVGSGHITCADCVCRMVARPLGGVPGYVCKGCSSERRVFAEYVDQFLRTVALTRLSDPRVAASMSAALVRVNDEAAALTEKLGRDRELMAKLGRDLANEETTYELVQAVAGPTNKRIRDAERRLAELSAVTDEEVQAEDWATLASAWDSGDVAVRRDMVRDATRGVRVEILPGRNERYTPERMVEWEKSRVRVVLLESPLG